MRGTGPSQRHRDGIKGRLSCNAAGKARHQFQIRHDPPGSEPLPPADNRADLTNKAPGFRRDCPHALQADGGPAPLPVSPERATQLPGSDHYPGGLTAPTEGKGCECRIGDLGSRKALTDKAYGIPARGKVRTRSTYRATRSVRLSSKTGCRLVRPDYKVVPATGVHVTAKFGHLLVLISPERATSWQTGPRGFTLLA